MIKNDMKKLNLYLDINNMKTIPDTIENDKR